MKRFYSTFLMTMMLFACKDQSKVNVQPPNSKVLFVVSNATHYGTTTLETTNNFPEIIFAYHEFEKENIAVDFMSPKGGQVPIGYVHSSDSLLQHYLFDQKLFSKLKNTIAPNNVDVAAYRATYFVGGGSAMFGVPENNAIQEIAQYIVEENKGILAAICHGTAGIVNIKNKDGEPMVKNRKITGFPDAFEDTTATYYKQFPFAIDKAISDQGAKFEYSPKGWDGFYIKDGNIITGQDPSGAQAVAKEIIKELQQIRDEHAF